MSERGYVHVYTGNGKGKTTAAVGLALRALGRGWRVYLAQFMKNQSYGEIIALQRWVSQITIEQFATDSFVFQRQEPSEELKREALRGVEKARTALLSGTYQMVILDEICVTFYFHLLDPEPVLGLVRAKPAEVELVLTGRYCPEVLIEQADLVTEMREIRHYYQRGVLSRKGVDF